MNTRVLSYWQSQAELADQSAQNQQKVWDEFQQLIYTLDYSVDVQSIHTPESLAKWAWKTSSWHQDCGPEDALFITWSNIQPVEIRSIADGSSLLTEDGAVILIDNLEVEHRTPTPLHPLRWIARSCYIYPR